MPTVFRHESFLLTLPFDAALHAGFVLHVKDDRLAPRTPGWEAFDLQRYLNLDSPEAPGDIASTTLMFSRARGPRLDPWRDSEEAWPEVFAHMRAQHPWPRRLLYLKAVVQARGLLSGGSMRTPVNVVQAVRLAPKPERDVEEWQLQQLDQALNHLNDFLTAVASIRREEQIEVVGRRDFPPLMVGFGWDLSSDGTRSEEQWENYLMHDRVPGSQPTLSKPEADFAMWISAARDHPMKAAGDFILGATASLRRGRYGHAVIEACTAAELLVSSTVRLAGPLRGYPQEKLNNVLAGAFASRAKDHFAPIAGYSRDPETSGDALGTWWTTAYKLRNRVAHQGHTPSENEAFDAVEATEAFHHDLGGRLSAQTDLQSLLIPIPDTVVDAVFPDEEEHD
jgi:hypothetical protein